MILNYSKTLRATLLGILLAAPVVAQNARVDVAKESRRIPKSCERLAPAVIDSSVDVPALVKEAICKGAGDMLTEYTYTVNSLKREKAKNGKVKDETFVYEVFIPTLKSGMRAKGVLVVTSHNGVAVPPKELEKERLEAAEKIEKEEEKIARSQPVTTTSESDNGAGLFPLGTYTRSSVTHSAFGMKSGGVIFAIADFLRVSDLALARRENIDGRDTLVFVFIPRPGIQFAENEEYMAQVSGEIWIERSDRIVTRLIGWPIAAKSAGDAPPAVYAEMMRLPQPGIWFPKVIRINGADYQTLFNGIKTDSTSTYSNYIRFSTEVKEVEIEQPQKP